MKEKYNNPFNPNVSKSSSSKKVKSKTKTKLLECGDIYMLRTDSKKKALTVLQSKLHSERKNQIRATLDDYDSTLGEINRQIKGRFKQLERKLIPSRKVIRKIGKKKEWRETRGRKVRLGLFAKMLARVKEDTPKVRNIGIPKLDAISSK